MMGGVMRVTEFRITGSPVLELQACACTCVRARHTQTAFPSVEALPDAPMR